MSNAEAPISITVKTAKGSLVTVRADTADELERIVASTSTIIADAAHELESAVTGVSLVQASHTVEQVLGGKVIQVQTEQPVNPGIGGGRSCTHGKMTAIQGQGKDGKPYKGYFCPQAKGAFDKCRNQYIFGNDPEWNTFIPDKLA